MTLSAFRIRNATRNKKMSCEVDPCLTFFTARLRKPLASSRLIGLSRPNRVEACDIGVVGGDDDITLHLPSWCLGSIRFQGGGPGRDPTPRAGRQLIRGTPASSSQNFRRVYASKSRYTRGTIFRFLLDIHTLQIHPTPGDTLLRTTLLED